MTAFGERPDDGEAQLQQALASLGRMSGEDMSFASLSYPLRDINEHGRVGDVGRAAIGAVLKRVLLLKPPDSRDYAYVAEHMADLAYSEGELQAIEEAKRSATQRQAEITAEVAAGTDPWQAHAKHNKHNILNPLTVGFYQDGDGKVRPLYGPRYFQSKRQMENSPHGGRAEDKEVNLLDGEFVQAAPTGILKGTHWDKLPEDLRARFERGEILMTTGNDHYALTAQDTDQLARSNDPEAYAKLVDEKIQQANSKYLLLYYSDYRTDDTGRTAVVMTKNGDGELEPVVVVVGDKEFVVEVKGCGTKAGGFKGMQSRTGRDILTGGVEAEQARAEFYRLEDDKREGAPKAIGSIIFDNPSQMTWNPSTARYDTPYVQGYIVRLTPSTVRASFTGNEAYPDIEQPELVARVLQIYALQLATHIFSDPPKILYRSSHTENMLLWGNGEATFTDYSDHVVFANGDFPHYESHGGYITPKKMLEHYLAMAEEIPGYRADRDQQTLYAYLSTNLEAYGIVAPFAPGEGVTHVVDKIWQGGMAYQVYKGRKQGHYFPEGVLRQHLDNFDSGIAGNDVPRDSTEVFVAGEAQARQDLLDVVAFYRINSDITLPEGVTIEGWEQAVRTAPVSALSSLAANIHSVQREANNRDRIDSNTRRWLYEKTRYYESFDSIIVSQFREYFEHELDVVAAAQQGCPEEVRAELAQAEQEVRARLEYLRNLVDNDLAGLFEAVSTPEAARRLLSFSFYEPVPPAR